MYRKHSYPEKRVSEWVTFVIFFYFVSKSLLLHTIKQKLLDLSKLLNVADGNAPLKYVLMYGT